MCNSEMEQLVLDAKRWRGFLAAARIRRLGFAGLRQHKSV